MKNLIALILLFILNGFNPLLNIEKNYNSSNKTYQPGVWESYLSNSPYNSIFNLTANNQVGDLIWRATFESGDKSEWCINQSGCGEYNMNESMVKSEVTKERAKNSSYSMKMTINTSNGYASTQHWRFREPNTHKDLIYTIWFYVPQKFDYKLEGWSNIIQWKVEHNNIPATNTPKSHPLFVMGYGVRGRNGSGGNNYLTLARLNRWFDGYSSPTTSYQPLTNLDIPINQWFKVTVRYVHGTNNNGRVMLWQSDESGKDVLLYDIKNVTTYPLKNSDGQSTKWLAWSVNLYGDQFVPSTLSHFIDDVSFHLPANEIDATPTKNSILLESSPPEGGKVRVSTGGGL
ncbi:heparin lyase I family protein [Fontibacter flavus]|uniref:Heparin lyase I family protein n=1 Tax=Fontibacter flavus TaxID=654838 RepID=A0ABV6FPR0_9BACT